MLKEVRDWYQSNKQYFYSDTVVAPTAESSQFIKNAIKRPGALTAKAKAAGAMTQHGTIKLNWVRQMAKRHDLTGQQARFYLNVLRRR